MTWLTTTYLIKAMVFPVVMHLRRKWQPTPMFLPGGSQGQRSLVGCHVWGCTELDTTEVTSSNISALLNINLSSSFQEVNVTL